MAEKKASDIFITAKGAPIHPDPGAHHADQPAGHGTAHDQPDMIEEAIPPRKSPSSNATASSTSPSAAATWATSASTCSGSATRLASSVVRYIQGDLSVIRDLGMPPLRDGDGAVEARPGRLVIGATGSDQVDRAGVDARSRNRNRTGSSILTVEDPIEYLFYPSRPKPVVFSASRHRHPELGRGTAQRHASGARLHPDRRDP